MKWKSAHRPKQGEVRIRRIFALFPRRCNGGITRWLCNVLIAEEYSTIVCSSGFYSSWNCWNYYEDTPENIEKLKSKYSAYINPESTKV